MANIPTNRQNSMVSHKDPTIRAADGVASLATALRLDQAMAPNPACITVSRRDILLRVVTTPKIVEAVARVRAFAPVSWVLWPAAAVLISCSK